MRSFVRTLRAILWVTRLGFRFFSGRPMNGERKTDATFWRPATRSLDPSGTALRWEMMRGASRAAWRLGVSHLLLLMLLLPLLWVAGSVSSPPWWLSFSVVAWSNLLLIGGGSISYLLLRAAREYGYSVPCLREVEKEDGRGALRPALRRVEGAREWRKERLLPLAKSLSVTAGVHIPERKAHEWVTVPKGFRDGAPVRLRLPAHFTGADEGVKKRLVSSVSAKLGTPGMSPSWMLEGSSPELILTAPPIPPGSVSYADVEELLLNSEEYRPLLGLTGGGKPFVAEMIDDSPHIGLSAGSGAGKSTMAKAVIAQALRWGWGVVVLDWKQSGAFSWLGGLEGVTYLSGVEQIHDMGVRLAEEVDLRKVGGMAGKAKVLVVRDEWNVTADLLMAYWQDLRSTADPEEKRTMPLKSPALRGYSVLDFAGREYGLFDFCIGQRFSARIFNGNADIREVFAIKLLARYSPQTVKMLAPDIKPFPRKSNHRGRWVAVVADEATVIQGIFLTNDEARELACGGMPNPKFPLGVSQVSQGGRAHSTQGDQLRHVAGVDESVSSHVNSSSRGSKLSEIAKGLGISTAAMRKIVERNASEEAFLVTGGDQFKGYRYDAAKIREWMRRREAAKTAERSGK